MDIKQQKALWDSFLERWPRNKLNEMTLEQYVSYGDTDTFTYWLETKTRSLGSIQGNTSAKFGIYKRGKSGKPQSWITHGEIYSWQNRYGSTETEAFQHVQQLVIQIAEAAFKGDLKTIEQLDFSPMVKWKIAFLYQNQEKPTVINTFSKRMLEDLLPELSHASHVDYYQHLIKEKGAEELLTFGTKCWAQANGEQSEEQLIAGLRVPLNQILYGPPGTGKTYQTIESAVQAAEPDFYRQLMNQQLDDDERRNQLKTKYQELIKDQRVRFVTFHQSYGYEEFVEGISAETADQSDTISYFLKPGVFRQICDDARFSTTNTNEEINPNGTVWKISLQSTSSNPIKTYCLENNLAAVGWDDTGDMLSSDSQIGEQSEYFSTLGRNNQNSLRYFSKQMTKGDLVLCINSNTSVEAIGVVDGDYYYSDNGVAESGSFCHLIPVNWLVKGFSIDFKQLNGNKQFNLPTCYPLDRLSVADTIAHLEKNNVNLGHRSEGNVDNYVLIIDEINRGNISKIFGELITLIEPSKREGNDESLQLILPYSGMPFSVPNNLYLIGTMNTADRSLAMMDTALRRRFEFIEMMPEPDLLGNVEVNGIDLTQLLDKLNQRIEVLYDREHTLGHAFFMPVKVLVEGNNDNGAFSLLISVFQNKIIPLLQEYFFEDWQKIRLVLGDNQKPEVLQFIEEKTLDNKELNTLFGEQHNLNAYGDELKQYTLKEFGDKTVWTNPAAYIGIYQPKYQSKSDDQEPSNGD